MLGERIQVGYSIVPYFNSLLLMNEGSGSTLKDCGGNSNPGILYNGSWTAGKFGCAVVCNGTSTFIDLGTILPRVSWPCALAAWVKFNVTNAQQTIVYMGDGIASGSSTDNFRLFLSTDGKIRAGAWRGSGGGSIASTTVLQPNVWYHLVAWFPIYGYFGIFVNGILEAYGSTGETVSLSTPWYQSIGAWVVPGTGAQEYVNGVIDHAYILDKQTTVQEIQNLYMNPFGMFEEEM